MKFQQMIIPRGCIDCSLYRSMNVNPINVVIHNIPIGGIPCLGITLDLYTKYTKRFKVIKQYTDSFNLICRRLSKKYNMI